MIFLFCLLQPPANIHYAALVIGDSLIIEGLILSPLKMEVLNCSTTKISRTSQFICGHTENTKH